MFDAGTRVQIKDKDFRHLGTGPVRRAWFLNQRWWYEVAFDSGEYAEVRIPENLLEEVVELEAMVPL